MYFELIYRARNRQWSVRLQSIHETKPSDSCLSGVGCGVSISYAMLLGVVVVMVVGDAVLLLLLVEVGVDVEMLLLTFLSLDFPDKI